MRIIDQVPTYKTYQEATLTGEIRGWILCKCPCGTYWYQVDSLRCPSCKASHGFKYAPFGKASYFTAEEG